MSILIQINKQQIYIRKCLQTILPANSLYETKHSYNKDFVTRCKLE